MEERTTTTTTTTTSASQTTIGVNVGFLTTPSGILIIVEFVLTLLAWTLLVSVGVYSFFPELGFAAFGFVFSWLLTLGLFVVFVFGLHASTFANLPWGTIQIFCDLICALLCFIAACCVASRARRNSHWQASCAFGFIATVMYAVSVLVSFRRAYGRFPWQNGGHQPSNT